MWLSGLIVGLQTTGSLVQFPVRAHAEVAGQVPSRGRSRGNQSTYLSNIDAFLSLSPSFSLSLRTK